MPIAVSIAIVALLAAAPALAQCPMCKTAVSAEDPTGQGVTQGYFHSILLLFSAPFILLGLVGGVVYLSYRTDTRRKAVGEP